MKNSILKGVSALSLKSTFLFLTIFLTQSLHAVEYPEAGDFSRGSKVWSENCARCHNMRNPSDLNDGLTSLFHMRIRAELTGQETRDIVTFLKGVNIKPTSSGINDESAFIGKEEVNSAISGNGIYENNCVACHGENGKGSFSGVPDFTDKSGPISKEDSELLTNIINGIQSPDSSMPMPPRGGNNKLSEAELRAALQYIKFAF